MKTLNKHSKLTRESYKVIVDIYCHYSTINDLINNIYIDKNKLKEKFIKDSSEFFINQNEFLLDLLKLEISIYKNNLDELDSTFFRKISKIEVEFRHIIKMLTDIQQNLLH